MVHERPAAALLVLDFPLFVEDEESGGWTFMHHPFTAAILGDEEKITTDPGSVVGQHYDLIWNGWELGSGSIRIHRSPSLQEARLRRPMGLGAEEQREKFGFLLEALRMGAPPHWRLRHGHRSVSSRSWAGEPDIRPR